MANAVIPFTKNEQTNKNSQGRTRALEEREREKARQARGKIDGCCAYLVRPEGLPVTHPVVEHPHRAPAEVVRGHVRRQPSGLLDLRHDTAQHTAPNRTTANPAERNR